MRTEFVEAPQPGQHDRRAEEVARQQTARAVVDAGLWDEHVVVRQGPTPGLPDTVERRLRMGDP